MNLNIYDVEDLLLVAVKSEVESRDFYNRIADRIRNALLKDRLKFLSNEEEKHIIFFESVFKEKFPNKEMILPDESPVPLPVLKIEDESMPISEILSRGMEAELSAHSFYEKLADRFGDSPQVKSALLYISSQELGHYKLLEIERGNIRKFEDVDFEWPMMHIGP